MSVPVGQTWTHCWHLSCDAMENSRSHDPHHRYNQKRYIAYFVNWIARNKPRVAYMHEVDYDLVRKYIDSLKQDGKSIKTAKHYASVIGQASRYWAARKPNLHRIIPITHPWFAEEEKPEKNYLTVKQAFALWKLVRTGKSMAAKLGVALGAFAGFDLQDIRKLRVRCFHPESDAMDIKESKNKHRVQDGLPLHRLALIVVKEAAKGRKPDDFLVSVAGGGVPKYLTMSRAVQKALNRAAELDEANAAAFMRIDPKDLRKTFGNIMTAAHVGSAESEAYFGHAASTTFRKHYADYTGLFAGGYDCCFRAGFLK